VGIFVPTIASLAIGITADIGQFQAGLAAASRSAETWAAGMRGAASGSSVFAAANDKLTQSLAGQGREATQIAALQQRIAAVSTDAAGRVKLYTDALNTATQGSKAYYEAQLKLVQAQQQLDRQQAQGGGGGGIFGSAAGQVAGALGVVGVVATVTQGVAKMASEGNQLVVSLDSQHRTLNALLGDVAKGNQVWDEAAAFGEKYRYTQEQIGEAAQAAAPIIRNTTSSISEVLDVLARLQAKQPDKTFADAVRAVTELQSGQLQSLERMFNIPQAAAQHLSDTVKNGQDPIRGLDQLLTQLGVTDQVLETRTQGAAGAQNSYNKALEDFKISAGHVVQGSEVTQLKTFFLQLGSGLMGGPGVIQTAKDQAKQQVADIVAAAKDVEDLQRRFAALQAEAERQRQAARQAGDSGGALSAAALEGALGEQRGSLPTTNAQLYKDQADALNDLTDKTDRAYQAQERLSQQQQTVATVTALAKEDIDRMGASLQYVEEVTLRPYKSAVDAASDSLKKHQQTTQDAQQAVSDLQKQLSAAQKDFQMYASARLAEDVPYQNRIDALTTAQEEAQKRLLTFEGAPLHQLIDPIQAQVDQAKKALPDLQKAYDTADAAVKKEQRTLERDNETLKTHEAELVKAKDVYDALKQKISDNTSELEKWRSATLEGTGAFDKQLGGLGSVAQSIQLRLDNLKLSGASEASLKGLENQLSRIQLLSDRTNLQKSLALGPAQQEIADFGKSQEYDAATILAHMQAAKTAADQATAALPAAKAALDDATAARNQAKAAVDDDNTSLKNLNNTLDDAKTRLETQKKTLSDLKTQLDDTRTNALKPFQDAEDDASRHAELAKLDEHLAIDPLKKKIQDATATTKLMTFKEIIDGATTAGARMHDLNGQLTTAQTILDKEEGATKEAQAHYQAASDALTMQERYFSSLGGKLDDYKARLAGVEQMYKDIAALEAGLITTMPGVPQGMGSALNGNASPMPNFGSGSPYSAQAIDAVLAKAHSPLTGQGQFIIDMSLKYGVPVEVALAMWDVEGQYGTKGASVANRNPGNLRASPFAAGRNNGFALFDSWKAGIEGFFDLLRHDPHGYNKYVDQYQSTGDLQPLLKLIQTYAPSLDHNDPSAYFASVSELIKQLLQEIRAGAVAHTFSRGSVSEEVGIAGAGGTHDTILSDQAIDLILRGGRETGSYHGDRTEMATRDNPQGIDLHGGVDIAGQWGADVRIPHGGHVVAAAPNKYGGTAVIIENEAGEQWYFGHLQDKVDVKVGQDVAAGTVIGQIGDMGHVHVQEKVNGILVDPTSTLEDIAAGRGAGAIGDAPGGSGAPGPTAAAAATQTAAAGAGLPAAGSSFAADAASMMALIQQGIDTLQQLTKYRGASHDAITKFTTDIAFVVTSLTSAVKDFDKGSMAAALQWSTATGALLSVIDTGMMTLGELKKYKGVTRDQVVLFTNDLYATLETFTHVWDQFDRQAMAGALQWNMAASQVLAIVDSGVAALTEIGKYKGITRNAAVLFTNDLYATIETFSHVWDQFDRQAMADAVEWEMSAGQILTVVGQGVDALTAIAKYRGVPQRAVTQFAQDVRAVVDAMQKVADTTDQDGVDSAAAFAGSAGQILTTVGTGVSAFTQLDGYVGIAPDAIAAFQGDLGMAIDMMRKLADRSDQDGVAAAAQFADSAGRIIAPMSNAMDTFAKMKDYKGVARDAVLLIENDINGVIETMATIVANTKDQGVAAAADFSDSVGKILAPITTMIETVDKLSKYKGITRDQVLLIGYDILGTVETLAVISSAAGKGDAAKAANWAQGAGKLLGSIMQLDDDLVKIGKYKGMDPKGLQRLMNDYNAVVKASVQQSTVTMDQVWATMNAHTDTAWQTWFRVIEKWGGEAVLVMGDDARQIGALAGDIVSSVNKAKDAVNGLHVPSGGGGSTSGGNRNGNLYTFRVPGLSTLGQRATQQRSRESRPVQLFQQNHIDSEQLAQHLASRTASELARRLR
jgi:hypothetical protein